MRQIPIFFWYGDSRISAQFTVLRRALLCYGSIWGGIGMGKCEPRNYRHLSHPSAHPLRRRGRRDSEGRGYKEGSRDGNSCPMCTYVIEKTEWCLHIWIVGRMDRFCASNFFSFFLFPFFLGGEEATLSSDAIISARSSCRNR